MPHSHQLLKCVGKVFEPSNNIFCSHRFLSFGFHLNLKNSGKLFKIVFALCEEKRREISLVFFHFCRCSFFLSRSPYSFLDIYFLCVNGLHFSFCMSRRWKPRQADLSTSLLSMLGVCGYFVLTAFVWAFNTNAIVLLQQHEPKRRERPSARARATKKLCGKRKVTASKRARNEVTKQNFPNTFWPFAVRISFNVRCDITLLLLAVARRTHFSRLFLFDFVVSITTRQQRECYHYNNILVTQVRIAHGIESHF